MFGRLFKILITMGFSLGLYIGCSKVGFEAGVGPVCQQLRNQFGSPTAEITPNALNTQEGCTYTTVGYERLIYPEKISAKLDLLFVIDNSGSMSAEQTNISNNFSAFITELERNSSIFYQIGIITTDSKNRGALVGNIISNDPSNPYYTANAVAQFQKDIQRPETTACEDSSYDINSCPSGLESGIKNINHFLDKGYSSFFRDRSLFSVIVISDEDENSRGRRTDLASWPSQLGVVKMQAYNEPQTLIDKITLQLSPTKKFSFNAVIAEDQACLDTQNAGITCGARSSGATSSRWFYKNNHSNPCSSAGDRLRGLCFKKPCAVQGDVYKELVGATKNSGKNNNILSGNVVSICNYSRQQLTPIARQLNTYLKNMYLHCSPLKRPGADIRVSLSNKINSVAGITFTRNGRSLSFHRGGAPISLPKDTIVKLDYDCLRSI